MSIAKSTMKIIYKINEKISECIKFLNILVPVFPLFTDYTSFSLLMGSFLCSVSSPKVWDSCTDCSVSSTPRTASGLQWVLIG